MIISIITVFQTKCFYGQINDRLERNPSFSIAYSATFTFLLIYHKHDRSTFSINWWVRQCDPNHLINGTERSTGSALSTWSSLSGFHWGHRHSCLLFSLSLSVTVMLCREKNSYVDVNKNLDLSIIHLRTLFLILLSISLSLSWPGSDKDEAEDQMKNI